MNVKTVKTVAYASGSVKTVAYASGSERLRVLDFVELTKPRIAVLVLFTVAVGGLLANQAPLDLVQLAHAIVGTALVAAGASALNQWLERLSDAVMRRTENRPLPSGRLSPAEAFVFGAALSAVGLGYMFFLMTHALAGWVTAATLLSYVFIYTPLKRHTTLNTLIGAVPGALPPVIGWTAMTGSLDAGAFLLFLIVFLWQVPHFLAIAWMYREDYGRAGLKMLPTIDQDGVATARQMLVYCVALVPVTLWPVLTGVASYMYGFGALALGVYFLRSALGFAMAPSHALARRVLHASLVYLPCMLGLLLMERWVRVLLNVE
jgi:protoheme IX farnesyltransferase